MSWSDTELARIGDATELELATRRADGILRPFTTMWVVRVGDDLYVRSAGGPDRPWYGHAPASAAGHVRPAGMDVDATFIDTAADARHDAIDAAYHATYERYGPGPVSHVTGPAAHPVTIRLVRSHA